MSKAKYTLAFFSSIEESASKFFVSNATVLLCISFRNVMSPIEFSRVTLSPLVRDCQCISAWFSFKCQPVHPCLEIVVNIFIKWIRAYMVGQLLFSYYKRNVSFNSIHVRRFMELSIRSIYLNCYFLIHDIVCSHIKSFETMHIYLQGIALNFLYQQLNRK